MCRFILTCFLLLAFAAGAGAEIEIRAPGQQTIPLALTSFIPQGGDAPAELAEEINAVLQADLELSGLFNFIAPASFLSDARREGLSSTQVDFSQWRMLGAESLVKGVYRLEGEQLIVEARLFDVTRRRMLDGRRYVGKPADARRMAHAFADQILRRLTGEPGPFNSKIAYISNATGHKELYLMDVDGHGPVRITNHRSIVLNPDFSPVGKELIFTSYKENSPDLYRKEIYSGREARLSSREGLNISGRYAPGGREIALTLSYQGNPEIYLMGTDGSLRKRLTDDWNIDVDVSWSPGGDRLAFVSDRQGGPHVFVMDVNGKNLRRLTPADLRQGQQRAPALEPRWALHRLFVRRDGGKGDFCHACRRHRRPAHFTPRRGGQPSGLVRKLVAVQLRWL
jgi:TolB protein